MRTPLAVALALLALPLLPAAPAEGVVVVDFDLTVDGKPAHGLVARPVGEPTALVVVAHGYGHTAESHRQHLATLAELGAVAVAMDYRGAGFPLRAGADDTIAATRALLDERPYPLVVLYSVSMGTAVAGMVLAQMPDTFDYWVSNEGLGMLAETWAGASLLAPVNGFAAQAKADIEAECGGTPVQAPACFAARSATLRAHELSGLQGAILAHGLHDGLVPYDQGRETALALRAAGIPTDFYTVGRGEAGGEGTTFTGYAGFQVDGLAGHGTESNDAHTLTALSFGLLYDLVRGEAAVLPADREIVVDREAGTLP